MSNSRETSLAIAIAAAADDYESARRLTGRLRSRLTELLVDAGELLAGDLPPGDRAMPEDRRTADARAAQERWR